MRDARERALDNCLLPIAFNELVDLLAAAGVDPVKDRAAQRIAVCIGRQGACPDAADGDGPDRAVSLRQELGDDLCEVFPPDALGVVLDEAGLRIVGVSALPRTGGPASYFDLKNSLG